MAPGHVKPRGRNCLKTKHFRFSFPKFLRLWFTCEDQFVISYQKLVKIRFISFIWESRQSKCAVNVLNHDYKTNNGRNFQFTKFLFNDFVLTDRRSLSGKRPKSASGKSFSCRYSFSVERNANTKATEYATFVFSFSILVFFLF